MHQPLPTLQPGEESQGPLRLDDLFFFQTTRDGLLELFLIGPSGDGNSRVLATASRSISVLPHPEDPWNCAARAASAVTAAAGGLGMAQSAITFALAGWYAEMMTCQNQGADWTCYARRTAVGVLNVVTQNKTLPDAGRLLAETAALFDELDQEVQAETPPCIIAVDWLNAMLNEWLRQGAQPD
jgi:hypothetical protein